MRRVGEPGTDRKRVARSWFSEKLGWLPVQIEQTEKKGDTITLRLASRRRRAEATTSVCAGLRRKSAYAGRVRTWGGMRDVVRVVCCSLLRLFFPSLPHAADAPAAADYAWPNLTDFLKQLIAKVGTPVKVYKLTMDRDGKVDLWIQDQRTPRSRRQLRVRARHDERTDPGQVRALPEHRGGRSSRHRAHHDRFPAAAGMLASAKAKLGLPDARVFRIGLERGDSHGILTIRIFRSGRSSIDTPRHDGRVEFSLDGKVLDADKD